jgi:putative glycosyltransferase (TIGR04372 family)
MAVNANNRTFRWLSAALTPGLALPATKILWPILWLTDDFKDIFRKWVSRDWSHPSNLAEILQNDYDIRVVPYRAQHAGPLTLILHHALHGFGIVFVVNMIPGMGHNTIELDYFLRLLQSGRLPARRYVLLRKPNGFHNDTLTLYRHYFWFAAKNVWLNNFLAPIIARYKDMQLNVGLSRLRWQLRDDGSFNPPPPGQTYLYQVSKIENRAECMRYFALRATTKNITPLKDGLKIEPKLMAFLGGQSDRLALIHIKYHVGNATARPTDPRTYLSTIHWLQEQGFRVVMIGREKMPEDFGALGVLDYANSSLASYRFDLELVAHASIVITAGSGIALMPDCMSIPLVYLNSWHLGMPLPSERCVIVPTLVSKRADARILTIKEQCELYWALEDDGDEVFPTRDYEARDASEDEVLEATKEALALEPEAALSELQGAYRAQTMKDHAALVDARISQYFINKHMEIIEDKA